MNKKNFPIFISLFIVSLFFTIIFYMSYTNYRENYEYYMSEGFNHGELEGDISLGDIEKIKSIDGVKFVGKISLEPDTAKYKDNLVVINYQDEDINKMREYSRILEGRFAENDSEIVLSESFVKENNLKLDDKINLDIGKRLMGEEEIGPTSAYTDREKFSRISTKTYTIVGIYKDVYNKYSRLNYGLGLKNEMNSFRTFIKFDSFEDAYKNKDEIQKNINGVTGKNIKLIFNESLIVYYGVENEPIQNFMSKAVIALSIVGCALIFIFFTKNIFLVWGLRKIKELSVYKSIGSTDFQIYLSLLKEGIFISIVPIILGHISGFGLIYYLYKNIMMGYEVENYEYIKFNLTLSLAVIIISLIIVTFAIMSPAKKISKINIIDGIRGNIDFSKSKKKRSNNLWNELKLNNLASVKSQRYISSIGVIIISAFIIAIGMSNYYREFSYYDNGYNFEVDYFSKENEIPQVLSEIVEKVPNKKSYVTREKYVQVENNLKLSNDAEDANLNEEIEENFKKYNTDYYDGFIIALEDKDLKELGGDNGEFLLYNMVQKDSSIPISQAEKIPYFKNPDEIKIKFPNDYETEIKISGTISDLGRYKSRTMPFDIKIFTDFDTYSKLLEESQDIKNRNYPFQLYLDIEEGKTKDTKTFVENIIRDEISSEDRFNILT
ncbi:ABC transporter permease, partial [Peptoniphilus sp.]|uniref:ABC transporter permease n=1 Tax=Peptoniphilus sp. TaxID=1971214 RepID=UPI003D8EF29B